MKLTGKEPMQIKEAVRFYTNAGRKSAKAKEVRRILNNETLAESEKINRINATKPWQAHGPINP